MKLSAMEVLAAYFEDLLAEQHSARGAQAMASKSAPRGEAVVHECPRVRPQPMLQEAVATMPPAPEVETAALEEDKRLRLQRMLSQQTLRKPAPVRVEVEHKVREQGPVAKQVTLPQAEVKAQETQSLKRSPAPERLQWSADGRPFWAASAFDALLFDVSGLLLAVPLVSLGQIVPLSEKLTVLQGQSDWFMGILPSAVGDIRTVNTAIFVMPERYKQSFLTSAKYVVTIDGMRWGLAVDKVRQPITLEPEDVKWRSERSKRPWLAGTVKSHMCSLIDIPQMARLLESADKNRRDPG